MTFVFADLETPAQLALELGPGYRPVLERFRELLAAAVHTHGGTQVFAGRDSYFAAFPDAGAALTASYAAQRSLAAAQWPASPADPTRAVRPTVRIGLHSGQVQAHGGEYASPEVHRAARVAAAAHGGQVLCTAASASSAAGLPAGLDLWDLGLHRLRGFDGRERLFQLVAPDWRPRFPRPHTDPAPPHNLPAALTSFIGRAPERAQLSSLLTRHRVVTVTGPDGTGKTRLAVQVALDQLGSFPDGCWFADLTTVPDPDGVALTLAAVLGLPAGSQRPAGRVLLVLDGADAQPGAVGPVVSGLLATSPRARVLVTGRGPVGLPGERVWRLPPLSVRPGPDGRPGDALALLLDRVMAARGGQAGDATELPHLRRVAAQLAGSPRAIEQAAARLRVLSAGQLAARLAPSAPLPLPLPAPLPALLAPLVG